MKKYFGFLVSLSVFFTFHGAITTFAQKPDTVVVDFGAGGKFEVTEWTFVYEYGDSDDPPEGFFEYVPKRIASQDLWVETDQSDRRIPGSQLLAIVFGRSDEDVSIHLVGGEILKIAGRLTPPKEFLNDKLHVFAREILLEGHSSLWDEDTGRKFSTPLHWDHYSSSYPGKPLKEIRFQTIR